MGNFQNNNTTASGKRKTAIATATLKEGNGLITVNKRPVEYLPFLKQLEVKEPLAIAQEVLGSLNYDINVSVRRGGIASQIEAARLAIARVLVKHTKSDQLKSAFLKYDRNLMVADTRRKEPYKPGDSKARAGFQTSYR